MVAIVMPTSPLPQSANPKPLDYGGWQTPIGGGTDARLDRLGSRFAMAVQTPRLKPEPDGRIWVSRLIEAISVGAEMAFPQVGFAIGNPGAPVIDGAGQGGAALALRGMTPGYTIREGQFFTLVYASRKKLLKASADVVVGADGKVIVPIWPLISIAPADGATCNFAAPVIQGRVSGNENGWTLQRAGVSGLQFVITETR